MWKMTFEIFIKSLRYETPWVRKSKKIFVNQSHPTKIMKVRGIFVFLNFFVLKK